MLSKLSQKNYNLIQTYNLNQAKQLTADVAKYDFIIPKKEVIAKLNQAAEELKKSPLVVGDAQKTANRLIEGAKKIINENSGKGSGLLQARKDFDIWVKKQKPKVFDATSENAFTIANDTVRTTLNMISEKSQQHSVEKYKMSHKRPNHMNLLDPSKAFRIRRLIRERIKGFFSGIGSLFSQSLTYLADHPGLLVLSFLMVPLFKILLLS